MTQLINSSQVIACAPNTSESFSYTYSFGNSPLYFAYAVEHCIMVYNRKMLSNFIVATDDPTSKIVCFAFFNYEFIFAINDNNILYKIALVGSDSVIVDKLELAISPITVATSKSYLFLLTSSSIYYFNLSLFGDNDCMLSKWEMHSFGAVNNVEILQVAPGGRALATYKKGGTEITIWNEPFRSYNQYKIEVEEQIVDFQFGNTEHLSAVIADNSNTVSLWKESCKVNKLEMTNKITFRHQVKSCAFIILDSRHIPQQYTPASSISLGISPTDPQPPIMVLASTTSSTVILKPDNNLELEVVVGADFSQENDIFLLVDSHYVYSAKEVKNYYSITRLSKQSLSFFIIEQGKKYFNHFCIHKNPFICEVIRKIWIENDSLLTQLDNGACFDWSNETVVKEPRNVCYAKKSKIFYHSYGVDIDFEPASLASHNKDDFTLVVAISPSRIGAIFFEDQIVQDDSKGFLSKVLRSNQPIKHRIMDCEQVTDDFLIQVSIHSTDLFVVTSNKAIYAFFYQKQKYTLISKRELISPRAFFVPHPLTLIACTHSSCLEFFVVLCGKIMSATELGLLSYPIKTAPLTAVGVLNDGSLVVSTKKILIKLSIPADVFPVPIFYSKKLIMTSLSLCFFNALVKGIENQEFKAKDFLTRGVPETFYSIDFSKSTISDILGDVKSALPEGWMNLDMNGMIYIISSTIALIHKSENLLPLFGIWGLLSSNKHTLVSMLSYTSVSSFLNTCMSLWAPDREFLIIAISNFVSKHKPIAEELDAFLLLCVLVKKFIIAQKTAASHGHEKLANTLTLISMGHIKKKILTSGAYRAIREHRQCLASLLFCAKGEIDSSVRILKGTPLLMILAARVLEYNQFFDIVEDFNIDSLNGFYLHCWKKDYKSAAEALATCTLPNCPILNLEFHRYEILIGLGYHYRSLMLNLQPFTVLVNVALSDIEETNEIHSSHSESTIQTLYLKTNEEEDHNENSYNYNIDFGITSFDNGDIYYSYSDNEEEDHKQGDKESNEPIAISNSPERHLFRKLEETDIKSSLLDSFSRRYIDPKASSLIGMSQYLLVRFISHLFLEKEISSDKIKVLNEISQKLLKTRGREVEGRCVVFTMLFFLAKTHLLTPMLDGFINDEMFDVIFLNVARDSSGASGIPDFLSGFVSGFYKESDKSVVRYLIFDKILSVLVQGVPEPIPPILYYFHFLHRYLFNSTDDYKLSNNQVEYDITPLFSDAIPRLKKMQNAKINERYQISLIDNFISPFMYDRQFTFTRSFISNPSVGQSIKDVCINPRNNMNIAVVSKSVKTFFLTNKESEKSDVIMRPISYDWSVNDVAYDTDSETEYMPDFDSPISDILPQIANRRLSSKFSLSEFSSKWKSYRFYSIGSTTKCLASHPTEEIFVSGDSKGCINLYEFSSSKPKSYMKISDDPLEKMKFNSIGDQLLLVSKRNKIYISNLSNSELAPNFPDVRGNVSWVNDRSQIVYIDPVMGCLSVVDTLDPTTNITFGAELYHESVPPIDTYGPYVVVGTNSGCVHIYDIRSGRELKKLTVHVNPVNVIKFDGTGTFFVTASTDNMAVFVDMTDLEKKLCLSNVLQSSTLSKKQGVTCLAVSKQVIVAGGHSSSLSAWTATGP